MTEPGTVAEPHVTGATRVAHWKRAVLLFGVALISLQALWMLALPAFFGMDEFDHAYRATSVADGHWGPGTRIPDDGRGYLIRVPADIVSAAHGPCEALDYTRPDNCTATTTPDENDTVLIASGAATYNPVWYAVIGTAAKPFSGDTALIAMRLIGALACDAFLVAAAAMALRRSTSIWPFLGVILVGTPSLLYATTVAAPNGLNYSAAILMWVAGLDLLAATAASARRSAIAFTIASSTVMFTHTTGIMWVALSLVCTVPLWWGRGYALVQRDRASFFWGGAVIGIMGAACFAWIVVAHTNDPAGERSGHLGAMPASAYVSGPVQWTLQAIATMRFRNTPAPLPVYGLSLAVLIILSVVALRTAHRRFVLSLAAIAIATTATPLLLTYLSYDAIGMAWQGRYGLPLSVGFLLVAVEALRNRPPPIAVWGLIGALATIQTLTVGAAFRENRSGALHDPIALVVLGGAIYFIALGIAARRSEDNSARLLGEGGSIQDQATSRPNG